MTEPQDPFATPPAGAQPPPPYGAPAYGQPLPYGTPLAAPRNGFGTWSLVLGIVSFCGLFAFLLPPALAVVLGLVGRSRARRGEASNGGIALAGIVTGSVALLLGVVVWGFLLANWDAMQRYQDCQSTAHGDRTAEQACADQLSHDLFGVDPERSR